MNSLKNAPSQPQPTGCHPLKQSTHKYTLNDSKHGNVDEAEPNEDNLVTVSQLRLEFHRAYITRRKQNVVVTGLPETRTDDDETDKEADNTAFIKYCEENLSVKPPLARKGCVRLGKTDGVRPRRLLVHLTSESNATNILSASKALQRSDDISIAKNVKKRHVILNFYLSEIFVHKKHIYTYMFYIMEQRVKSAVSTADFRSAKKQIAITLMSIYHIMCFIILTSSSNCILIVFLFYDIVNFFIFTCFN